VLAADSKRNEIGLRSRDALWRIGLRLWHHLLGSLWGGLCSGVLRHAVLLAASSELSQLILIIVIIMLKLV